MTAPARSVPVVAIDGPVGSGKGTISTGLARRLGWHFLDSGSLYRLVAVAALDAGANPADEAALSKIAAGLDFEFVEKDGRTVSLLAGRDVTDRLRTEEVSRLASRVAAVQSVRAAMVDRQRAFVRPPGLVADGRDMGTIIFPNADLKVYLTAGVEERAMRRYKQLKEKGESVNLPRLFREIKARDERDMTRAIAPLRPAEDAILIDSTENSIDEVLDLLYDLVKSRSIID